jgi:hypothetical protein
VASAGVYRTVQGGYGLRVPAPGSRRSLLSRTPLSLRPFPSPRAPFPPKPQDGQRAPQPQDGQRSPAGRRGPAAARIGAAAARIGRRSRALLREHILFVCVLIPAMALRADTMLGYRWQVWFNDSFDYVADAVDFHLDPSRPTGYSIFLRVLEPLHSYALVTSLQHLMGLAAGVMVYALARHRFRAPAWVASLAAVPVLYDAFQIQLEHLVMSDVPFEFLIMLAVTIVLWDKRPSMVRFVIAGALLGIADLVRSVGLPLFAVLVVYMIIQRAGWRAVAAGVLACVLPIVAYMGIFDIEHGEFAMTESTGVILYQRVMAFANCKDMPNLPTGELPLCVTTPVSQRPAASQMYLWADYSPLNRYPPSKFSPLPNKLAKDFAIRAIEAQPLGYAGTVWHDTWRVFDWGRTRFPNAATYDEYLFGTHSLPIPGWAKTHIGPYHSYAAAYGRGGALTKVIEPYAGFMRAYQKYVYLPGTIYGVILLIGLAGCVLAWRRIGGEALLPWLFSVALIVTPAATAEFDYRYVLPAVPFACLAAAMAFGAGTPARTWLAARRTRAPAAESLDDQRDLAEDTA